MEKNRMGLIKRLKTLIAAALVMFAAVLTVSTGARVALADEPAYATEPIQGVQNAPGFKWVPAEESSDGLAHYRVYNPLENPLQPGDNNPSHEACIGWWYFADSSHEHDFDGYLIRLDSDIDFSKYEFERNGGDPNQLSVGTEDLPFAGTFDGGGYTISNLTNEREGLQIQMDNGFFGWTREATIKNINFKNCYIGGSYRDGLVAGYAQDTFFLNILCEDCVTSVIPANNVLNLITNAGITGGTIAGVANGCTLYNCEMRAGRVVTNATAGVAALGGQPLYMGGLVGFANDTTIEYSRVTDKWVTNGEGVRERNYAEISGTYETAVSVANYSEVYVGGIVGGMQSEDSGSKVVDCYSTADVYGKAAIYFGVGLGLGVTRAYCGGITGIVWDGGDAPNLIERVHYAGNLHSYQYNQLLLGIPIIQHDEYMGGIVSVGGKNVTINQAYFDRSASSTKKEIPVYRNWTTDTDGPLDGSNYGPRQNDYTDRDFWESEDFDFAEGTLRNEGYPFTPGVSADEWDEDHYNKWAMDYERGIPVHSGSIKATMDFPGSGTVTIGTTTLSNNDESEPYKGWLTTDPYDFAVQGYTEGAAADDDVDHTIDVNYVFTTDKNSSWAADDQNAGFRFMGWYASRDVRVNNLPEQHSLFTTPNSTLNTQDGGEGLISDDGKYLWQANKDGNEPDTLTVKYPTTPDDLKKLDYADNDLYVAYAQVQVLLHNTDKIIIHHNESGTVVREGAEGVSDDWYDYEQSFVLPTEIPAENKGSGVSTDTAKLIGWTTDPEYMNVLTSDRLDEAKRNGVFYEAGSTFTVTEPVNLYPVYSDLISNINVIYEGHDMDATDNKLVRDNFGKAEILSNEGSYSIKVTLDPKSSIAADSVRFIGWYEEMEPGNSSTEVRVSSDEEFNLDGVDLTREHTYTARFEYKVTYLDEADGGVYATEWKRYGTEFTNYTDLAGADDEYVAFKGWRAGSNHKDIVPDSRTPNTNLAEDAELEKDYLIRYPMTVHAHWLGTGIGDNEEQGPDDMDMLFTSDFPGAAEMQYEGRGGTWETATVKASAAQKKDYNLYGWVGERSDGVKHSSGNGAGWMVAIGKDNTPISGYNASSSWSKYWWNAGKKYWNEVHASANVTFHMPTAVQENNIVVERAYEQQVFMAQDATHTFTFNFDNNKGKDVASYTDMAGVNDAGSHETMVTSFTQAASPTDEAMEGKVPNSVFMGWINADELLPYEFNYVFDGADLGNGVKVVTNIERALPYLYESNDTDLLCYKPMDLYPVFTTFDLETTTNIAEAGVDDSIYNIPDDPTLADNGIESSVDSVKVTYNEDQIIESLAYNERGQASVKVTVDTETLVWIQAPEEDENQPYTFVSLSVIENGEEIETISADKMADGTATYTIQAGRAYKFRANYSPVPVVVTYHLSDGGEDTTESYPAEVGQVLPTPKGTPSFSGHENDFVVGWAEGDADGSVVNWPAEDLTILTPGSDTVTGTMHLWPVYRSANIEVNSNIDTQERPNDFRRAVKHDGDETGLWLEADDVDRYEFKGWYTNYSDSTESATLISGGNQHRLSGDELFPEDTVTYTAVYEMVNQVRYHDTEGNVIYTASVDAESDRTFVTTQEVSVTKPDGSVSTESVTVPIDTGAFTAIAASIQNKNNGDGATSYEQFVMWQWVDKEGIAHRWGEGPNNFINQEVSDNVDNNGYMDLYPVTMELTATDSENKPYTDIEAQLSLNEDTNKLDKAMVTLQSSYKQAWMKVHIDEVSYAPNYSGTVTGTKAAQANVPVELYTPGSQIGSPVAKDTTRSGSETVDGVNLIAGDALFKFSGRITITKTSTDASAAGRTFLFTVKDESGIEARTVTLQLPDEATNSVYTAKVTISVPFGDYTVTEDSGWAWRYNATVEHWERDTNTEVSGNQSGWANGGDVSVEFDSVLSVNNPDGVTSAVKVTNSLAKGNWLDGDVRVQNIFGIPNGNAGNGGE